MLPLLASLVSDAPLGKAEQAAHVRVTAFVR